MDTSHNKTPGCWRGHFRFSVRLLLIIVAVLCVWLAAQTNRARRQSAAVNAISAAGGKIRYDFEPGRFDRAQQLLDAEDKGLPPPTYPTEPPQHKWLRQLMGDEFFQRVAGVVFSYGGDIDERLLSHISSLADLEELWLINTDFSDADVREIGRLKNLRLLIIRDTKISDAGLSHLHSLRKLEQVNVINTRVTEKGVTKLKQLLPECSVLAEEPTRKNHGSRRAWMSKRYQIFPRYWNEQKLYDHEESE